MDNALNLFLQEVFVSLIAILIYVAKKKYVTKSNLFELYHWVLVIMVPISLSIPVILAIFPKSHIALAPYWIGIAIWIVIALTKKLNNDEKSHINKVVIQMTGILFGIGIFAHLLLQFLINASS